MTDWASINVQLLTTDCCSNILIKALQILDCLTSFHTDIIGTPLWPSIEDKHIPLFLFKIYFSNAYFDVKEVIEYLNIPSEEILLIRTKILTNNQSDNDATRILASFKISDIENQIDYTFITKILLNFDQILKLTIVGIWQVHKDTARQPVAAINLKTKMKSKEITSARAATAQAFAKATNTIHYNQALSAIANLRISNLERSMHKQEQKSNEIINQLKSNSLQKN
jgi:hypothetical protein